MFSAWRRAAGFVSHMFTHAHYVSRFVRASTYSSQNVSIKVDTVTCIARKMVKGALGL